MAKLSIRNLDVSGKRVLMRVDFNVPLDDACQDHRRHTHPGGGLPSIEHLVIEAGGRKWCSCPTLGARNVQWTPDRLHCAPVAARLGRTDFDAPVSFVERVHGRKGHAEQAVARSRQMARFCFSKTVRNVRFTYADDGASATEKIRHGELGLLRVITLRE